MKNSIYLVLLTALALTACQNEQAPQTQTPLAPTATTSEQMSQSPKPTPPEQHTTTTAQNAVAVTKSETTGAATSIREALNHSDLTSAVKAVPVDKTAASASTATKTLGATANTAAAKAAPVVKQTVVKQTVVKQTVVKQATRKPVKTLKKAAKTVAKKTHVPPVVTKPAITTPAKPVAIVGDAARGKHIARKCQACHNFTARKKVGPGLKGVFGRKAGIMPDMTYSKSLKSGGWVWNEKNLHLWDCNSKKAIKVLTGNPSAKTKMPPQHICDASKLADLTAFLKTL